MGEGEKKAAISVRVLEKYVQCCIVKGSCSGCPFYREGKESYLSGKCMGTEEYGALLMGIIGEIKKELKVKDGCDEEKGSGSASAG